MMRNAIKSYLLVAVQIGALLLIALTGPWIARQPLWLLIEGSGGLLGIWAVVAMRLGNFHIVPDVKADSQLVRGGPYRWLRHPMYTAILLVTLALVLDRFSGWRLLLWAILLVDLVLKLGYEEVLLVERFAEYEEYRRGTWRLAPGVW